MVGSIWFGDMVSDRILVYIRHELRFLATLLTGTIVSEMFRSAKVMNKLSQSVASHRLCLHCVYNSEHVLVGEDLSIAIAIERFASSIKGVGIKMTAQ